MKLVALLVCTVYRKKNNDEETEKTKKQKSDYADDPIEEATPNEEHPKLANKIVSTPKKQDQRSRNRERETKRYQVSSCYAFSTKCPLC